MTNLLRLARTLRHTRSRQIAARLVLLGRRKCRERAASLGLGPGNWYGAPAPSRRASTPIGPVIPKHATAAKLPREVDLVGTRWIVDVGMDWTAPSLDRGTYLEKLHLHYMDYLDGLSADDAAQLMVDWIRMVPPFSVNNWRHSWNSFALSTRVVSWVDVMSAQIGKIAAPLLLEIEQSVAAQARFLVSNLEHDIGGNHLLRNLRALMRAASYFKGDEPERWARKAVRQLDIELSEQILPDGMHFELSPSYHLQVMEDLLDIHRSLGSIAGDRSDHSRARVAERLAKMATIAQYFTHPDGLPSQFADGGLHMAASPNDVLEALERQGVLPQSTPRRVLGPWQLTDAGYVGFSGESESVIVDCGQVGAGHLPAHGHGDALALEWSVSGQRLLVDQGVFEYHAGPKREVARSTASHNTVTVDDLDQSEFWASFRVGQRAKVTVHEWQVAEDGFVLEASHDGYLRLAGAPTHIRRIEYRSGRIAVEDRIDSDDGHLARGRLLFAPGVQVGPVENLESGGMQVMLRLPTVSTDGLPSLFRFVSSAPMRIEDAVWWSDLGQSVATRRVVMEIGVAPCSARWSIEPSESLAVDCGQ